MVPHPPIVIGIGEVLFDCFPDRIVLGGAPANVAVHANLMLRAVGGRAMVLSRIGQDALGERICHELQERQVSTDLLQYDSKHPTGRVQVKVDQEGHADYTIETDAAWDHLAYDDSVGFWAGKCSAICFGTLAQRSQHTRRMVQTFLDAAPQALHVFDVNLRQSYYTAELIEQNLQQADVVKLNEHELPLVCELVHLGARGDSLEQQAKVLRQAYDLDVLALTRGARGTLLVTATLQIEGVPAQYPRQMNADTVGAGDACCAALVTGLQLDWPLQSVADFANQVGAFVATRPGATPVLPAELLERVVTLTTTTAVDSVERPA